MLILLLVGCDGDFSAPWAFGSFGMFGAGEFFAKMKWNFIPSGKQT